MKVLIVEDVTINFKLLENILSKYAKCDIAKNGEDGLKAFNKALKTDNPYDLICLDIIMPGISGLDVLQEIRKIDNGPKKVKILMTTAAADKENVVKAIKYGCDSYLIKPYNKQNVEEQLIGLKLYDPEVAAREQAEKEAKEKALQTAEREQAEKEAKEKAQQADAKEKPDNEAKEDTQQNVDKE